MISSFEKKIGTYFTTKVNSKLLYSVKPLLTVVSNSKICRIWICVYEYRIFAYSYRIRLFAISYPWLEYSWSYQICLFVYSYQIRLFISNLLTCLSVTYSRLRYSWPYQICLFVCSHQNTLFVYLFILIKFVNFSLIYIKYFVYSYQNSRLFVSVVQLEVVLTVHVQVRVHVIPTCITCFVTMYMYFS